MTDAATHIVIPDTQVKPGVRLDHLGWIGRYIVDQFAGKPNVHIIHIGDHWDMPSLSSWDKKGSKKMEGQRVIADIEAGNDGFELIDGPLQDYNAKQRSHSKAQWLPDKDFFDGNHEDRVTRAAENDAQLDGFLSLDLLKLPKGWKRHPFLEPAFIDGVGYAHYWYNPMSGRPYSGMIETRLKNVGHTFTMGHQQTLLYGIRYVGGRSQHGLVAGACYLHDEDYKGPQGNQHWRGIVVCHEVHEGSYDPMFVSLGYLCRRYEGVSLSTFLQQPRSKAA